jgi:hypothetical protein
LPFDYAVLLERAALSSLHMVDQLPCLQYVEACKQVDAKQEA